MIFKYSKDKLYIHNIEIFETQFGSESGKRYSDECNCKLLDQTISESQEMKIILHEVKQFL